MPGVTPVSARAVRPLRAVRRRARALRGRVAPPPPGVAEGGFDLWLAAVAGERLRELDQACAGAGPEALARFGDLDADLWALLLTQEQSLYPNIAALLPDVPEPALQELFNGASGVTLAAQSALFYRRLCERYARHGDRPLRESAVLDFGCGWGRLTRLLARDVAPGRLFGCDPVARVVEICRATRVPATVATSAFVPDRLPFDGPFDLAFAFSVFTHLSERAHERCLGALHAALRPGAILVVTVRPPAYLHLCELMGPALAELGGDARALLTEPRYVFVAHDPDGHVQYDGGEMTFGEAVVTIPYVRERWAPRFELLDADVMLADPYQVVLTLRRGPDAAGR